MTNFKRMSLFMGMVMMAVMMCAMPAPAQDDSCCGTCQGDKAACTASSCSDTQCADKSSCPQDKGDCQASCQTTACSAPAPEDMMAAAMNCEICKQVFEKPELMMACDYSVNDWSQGLIMNINMKDPSMMAQMREFEKHDKAMCEKFTAMSAEACADKLCPHCIQYLNFVRNGMKEERIETPTGTMIIARANSPKMLQKMHAFGAQSREMMASFDPSQMMASVSGQDCCGTCGGGQACTAGTTCSAGSTCSATANVCPKTGQTGTCTVTASHSHDMTASMSPDLMQEAMNCELCKMYIQNPEMMTASKCDVIYLKNGMALLSTVTNPSKVKAFQAFEKKFHDKIETMRTLSCEEMNDKLCSICESFGALEASGAAMDWNNTPTGTMTVITGNDDKLVAKIKDLGKTIEQMMPH